MWFDKRLLLIHPLFVIPLVVLFLSSYGAYSHFSLKKKYHQLLSKECPKCEKCPKTKTKTPIKKEQCTDFKEFSLSHWPNHLQNECFPEKYNKCCNIMKGDKGGLTCYGVSIEFNHPFYDYLKHIGHDLKNLTPEQARQIDSSDIEYYTKMRIYIDYYKKPKINEIKNIALRQVVFDNSVHLGQVRAIRLLQGVCGVNRDGRIGPNTLKNCSKVKYKKYVKARKKFLKTRPSWKLNENGFKNRLKRQKTQVKYSLKHSCK